MSQIANLGKQLGIASRLGLPPELVALVVTTTNAKRLQALFQGSSARLLEAHRLAQRLPASGEARNRRDRNKALLDLIRSRMALAHARKPTVEKMLAMMDERRPKNVVDMPLPSRKAA